MNVKSSSSVPMAVIQWVTGVAVAIVTLMCGYMVAIILPIASATTVLEVKMQAMEESAIKRDDSIERTSEMIRSTREEMLKSRIDPKKIEALSQHMQDHTISLDRVISRLERLETVVACIP